MLGREPRKGEAPRAHAGQRRLLLLWQEHAHSSRACWEEEEDGPGSEGGPTPRLPRRLGGMPAHTHTQQHFTRTRGRVARACCGRSHAKIVVAFEYKAEEGTWGRGRERSHPRLLTEPRATRRPSNVSGSRWTERPKPRAPSLLLPWPPSRCAGPRRGVTAPSAPRSPGQSPQAKRPPGCASRRAPPPSAPWGTKILMMTAAAAARRPPRRRRRTACRLGERVRKTGGHAGAGGA